MHKWTCSFCHNCTSISSFFIFYLKTFLITNDIEFFIYGSCGLLKEAIWNEIKMKLSKWPFLKWSGCFWNGNSCRLYYVLSSGDIFCLLHPTFTSKLFVTTAICLNGLCFMQSPYTQCLNHNSRVLTAIELNICLFIFIHLLQMSLLSISKCHIIALNKTIYIIFPTFC